MRQRTEVKICGLISPEMARDAVSAGADAIGLVFFPKSPRHVSDPQAKKIIEAVEAKALAVGVFVNADYDAIMARVDFCGIRTAQLHGNEPPELAEKLKRNGVGVIKVFFLNREPFFKEAQGYPADAFLVECAGEKLPGGNAKTWDWASAKSVSREKPLVLAGGLDPENVGQAISRAEPDAVDVSSGVEKSPGIKDLKKVEQFIRAVSGGLPENQPGRVFSS